MLYTALQKAIKITLSSKDLEFVEANSCLCLDWKACVLEMQSLFFYKSVCFQALLMVLVSHREYL